MYRLAATTFIILVAISASPVHDCENEMRFLVSSYDDCFPPEFDLNIGMRKINELAENKISTDDYVMDINEFCTLFLEAGQCLDGIAPVNGRCENDIGMQIFKNTYITLIVTNQHLCSDDNAPLLEFVDRNSAACFSTNPTYNECLRTSRAGRGLYDPNEMFSDRNICTLVNADLNCMDVFNDCATVKRHMTTSYENIKTKLNCT